MRTRRLLMLPLLFAVTIGGMLHALAEENQSNEPAEIRITECWFAGNTNNKIMFTCVLTNTTGHSVEVALGASKHKFLISTLTGEWLGNMGMLPGLYSHMRSKQYTRRSSLIVPAFESRVYEKSMGAFRFDKPHQGDVRVRVNISPCPYSFPTNNLPGVLLFNKDLKFDRIMEAGQIGDFLFVRPK